MVSDLITSASNTKVKLVRNLITRSRNRKAENAFIAEGVRLVEESAAVQWPTDFILYDETLSERGLALINKLKREGNVDVSEITLDLMSEISDTETPQGILAVLKQESLPFPASPNFAVIADQLRDPGNMGTLLRTAEAAGADVVILSHGTVDAFSPKVVRAAMGAHFHLPIFEKPWDEIAALLKGLPVFLAESEIGTPLWEADFQQPCALLIGGEAFGASPSGNEMATHHITIPMMGKADSFNAAIAAGILMAEVLRQRYTSSKE